VDTTGALAGVTLARISAGGAHACAVSTRGRVYCWGYATYGQVGDGTTTERHTAVLALLTVPPDPPTGLTGQAGDRRVTLSWAAPAHLGTGTATGYTVTASPHGATCTSVTTTCTVTGLTGGTRYAFTVVALAADDASDPSVALALSTPATPLADTGAPVARLTVLGLSLLIAGILLHTMRYRSRGRAPTARVPAGRRRVPGPQPR
jgi:hypothetical protein